MGKQRARKKRRREARQHTHQAPGSETPATAVRRRPARTVLLAVLALAVLGAGAWTLGCLGSGDPGATGGVALRAKYLHDVGAYCQGLARSTRGRRYGPAPRTVCVRVKSV